MVEEMSDNLIMPNDCLLALAKSGSFLDQDQLINFLKPWYGTFKYIAKLLIVFQKNRPYLDTQILLFKLITRSKRKSTLIILWTSKKLKNLDDLVLAEEACIIILQDKWFTKQGKAIPETKIWMKKPAKAEKKMVEKQDKAKVKSQTLEIRQLALSNR